SLLDGRHAKQQSAANAQAGDASGQSPLPQPLPGQTQPARQLMKVQEAFHGDSSADVLGHRTWWLGEDRGKEQGNASGAETAAEQGEGLKGIVQSGIRLSGEPLCQPAFLRVAKI